MKFSSTIWNSESAWLLSQLNFEISTWYEYKMHLKMKQLNRIIWNIRVTQSKKLRLVRTCHIIPKPSLQYAYHL